MQDAKLGSFIAAFRRCRDKSHRVRFIGFGVERTGVVVERYFDGVAHKAVVRDDESGMQWDMEEDRIEPVT